MAAEWGDEWDVERFAAAYEHATATNSAARASDFFPAADHPRRAEIATELLRIELELSWRQHRPLTLDEFRGRHGDVLSEPRQLEALAFEDYRQHCRAGVFVSPKFYSERYNINVDSWGSTVRSRAAFDSSVAPNESSVPLVPALSSPQRSADDPGLPVAGSDFCGFQLLEELGRGAFARVFLARQASLADRHVAIKISRGESVEPDRMAILQHSNIVPVYSVHGTGELQGLCMPYLGRHTLAHVMGHVKKGGLPRSARDLLSTIVSSADSTVSVNAGPLASVVAAPCSGHIAPSIWDRFQHANYVDGATWIVAQLAGGLAHAHERGILHRDLKPANVLVSDDGRPMILDFNLADRITTPNKRLNVIGGTIAYMAPEQLSSFETGVATDERSDVYALGTILFELLSGRLPYATSGKQRRSFVEIACDRHAPAPSVRSFNSDVPRTLAGVVARCLEPDRSRRYQTASDLREDLERHLENRPLRHVSNGSPRERLGKWARRHPRVSSAASVTLASLLVLGGIAAAWIASNTQLKQYQAREMYRSFVQRAEEARIPLTLVGVDRETYQRSVGDATQQLQRYGVISSASWRRREAVTSLEASDRSKLEQEVARTLLVLATSTMRQANAEPDGAEQLTLIQSARRWNGLALTSLSGNPSADNSSGLAAAIKRQASELENWRPGQWAIAVNLDEKTLALAEPELAASEFFRRGCYEQALPRLLEWRDDDRSHLSAWLLLGEAYVGVGNLPEAEACFTTCSRLRPQFALTYFQRGLTRLQQKNYDGAAADFTQHIKLSGDSAVARLNRALAYKAQGRLTDSLGDLDKAIAMGAPQTRVFFIRAAVHSALHDSAGAEADLRQGLSATPTDTVSYLARGMARLRDAPEQSLQDFERALQLDPGNRAALQNVLHVLIDRLNRLDDAIVLLDKHLATHPRDVQALATRAVVHARKGSAEPAEADATLALTLSQDPKLLFQIAGAYAQLGVANEGRRESALQLVARAIGAEPELAERAAIDFDLTPLRKTPEFQRIMTAAVTLRRGGSAEPPEEASN